MYFMGIVSIIGAVVGGVTLVLGFMGAKSAPQEAAAAAMAVAFAVVPYVIFRVLQLSKQMKDSESIRYSLDAINRRDEANQRPQ